MLSPLPLPPISLPSNPEKSLLAPGVVIMLSPKASTEHWASDRRTTTGRQKSL